VCSPEHRASEAWDAAPLVKSLSPAQDAAGDRLLVDRVSSKRINTQGLSLCDRAGSVEEGVISRHYKM